MARTIISTVLVPAPAPVAPALWTYDLITLDAAKCELSIPDNDTTKDTFLARAVSQISQTIQRHCNRVFAVEAIQDLIYLERDAYPWQIPGGEFHLQLSRWPIVSVALVVEDYDRRFECLHEGINYRVDREPGWLIRLDRFTTETAMWPAVPVKVEYTAGYTEEVYHGAATVPSAAPFTVTVAQAAQFAADGGVLYASGQPLAPVASNPAKWQYSVAAGVYTFNQADAGAAVLLSYRYAVIPWDVQDAAQRLLAGRYGARGRDPLLRAQTTPGMGERQYWIGSLPGLKGALPAEIAGLLEPYRVPVTA